MRPTHAARTAARAARGDENNGSDDHKHGPYVVRPAGNNVAKKNPAAAPEEIVIHLDYNCISLLVGQWSRPMASLINDIVAGSLEVLEERTSAKPLRKLVGEFGLLEILSVLRDAADLAAADLDEESCAPMGINAKRLRILAKRIHEAARVLGATWSSRKSRRPLRRKPR